MIESDEPVEYTLKTPDGYRVQTSCKQCVHCYRSNCHDSGTSYFCQIDKVPAPRSPTGPYDHDAVDKYIEARTQWELGREVDPAGICPKFEQMPVS